MKRLLTISVFLLVSVLGQAQINYQAYTGIDIVQPPATPNFGGLTKNGLIFYDTSYSSGVHSRVGRCTDAFFDGGFLYRSFAGGIGGSGTAIQLFNSNSTALHVENSGGSGYLALFNQTTMACSNAHSVGSGSWDWNNPTIWYNVGNPLIVQDTYSATGVFSTGPTILDWTFALPIGNNSPAWQASHAYTAGQYMSLAYPSPDWTANFSGYALGDIIQPTVANPAGCAFKLVTLGTTAASHSGTFWSSSGVGCVSASNGTITDGTAKWRNLDGPAVFVYQLTSASGTSGSTTPTLPAHPDLMTTLLDNGLTWTNVGVQSPPAWTDFAGVSRNSNRFCGGFSNNEYGFNANYTTWNGGQGSGIWTACYDIAANKYVLLNNATGWQSHTTCTGGTGYNCSGGTLTLVPDGKNNAYATCGFTLHNVKGTTALDWVMTVYQNGIPSGCHGTQVDFWAPFQTFNAATSASAFPNILTGHWAPGNHTFVNDSQNPTVLGGYSAGAYNELNIFTNPTGPYSTSFQLPCTNSWSPGNPLPSCTLGDMWDLHPSWAYNPNDTDDTPVCSTVYNYQTNSPVAVAPFDAEIVCISTSPRWTNVATPDPGQRTWRFTHDFNMGTNPMFSVQFGIGEESQDGRFYAFSSDMMCTLGPTDGVSAVRCGPQWTANTPYSVGQMLNPFANNAGSGTNYGVWQVTTGGTSASSHPTWVVCGSGNVGVTTTDANGLVYTCLGSGNARGDVFVVELASQQSTPTSPSNLIRLIQ